MLLLYVALKNRTNGLFQQARRTGTYTAELKVWIRNTWDWIEVQLRKSDVDYIQHHCKSRKECVPTLRRRGKNWYLDFAFEEKVKLEDKLKKVLTNN